MPAKTTIKLRAGTQSGWASTAMTQALTSSLITTDASGNLVARYTITGSSHTITVGQVLTITGVTVASGNLPYNISGGVVSGITTTTFDIKVASGTTAGAGSGGSAVLVVLATGEAAVETDTFSLKVGDGTTDWTNIPYIGVPNFYLVPGQTSLSNSTSPQDLFEKKLPLTPNTNYRFKIEFMLVGITGISKHITFSFKQSGSGLTGWNFARLQWSGGTNTSGTYGKSTSPFTGFGFAATVGAIETGLILYADNADGIVYATIEGIFQTGNGPSNFEPRLTFSATPGISVQNLAGSYATVEQLSPATINSKGAWVQ